MTHHKSAAYQIDWNDPQLKSLLRNTEEWKLDNRGNHAPQHVELFVGWAGVTARPAVLVWQRDKTMVLETLFPLRRDEHVRVVRHFGKNARTFWAIVADTREGCREEDRAKGVHVHWLHVR
ncbi:hypothetical protein MBSD_n2655 [Mizugakiibacter sediminis]|uniref:Uncharacterized protein n=1 Tax=Mizugakiibacter sediminis TaxID=1475481 RepID=A0A0K8QQY6_9GAMM|nr:hypothetical protein [Mizugakiibacter sediminis]GAP67334.1 hypothetical protein MBSD_n2655 [Mizugakiibacter sediminis]